MIWVYARTENNNSEIIHVPQEKERQKINNRKIIKNNKQQDYIKKNINLLTIITESVLFINIINTEKKQISH